MTIFDLVFLLLVVFTAASVFRIVYLLVRRRSASTLLHTKILGAVLVVYFAMLIVASAITPRKLIPPGEDRCFDDWCIRVDHVNVVPTIGTGADISPARGVFYLVSLETSSHARRITQRAKDASVRLVDYNGTAYSPSPEGQAAYQATNGTQPDITSALDPGSSFLTTVVFDLPPNAQPLGIEVDHGVWPGRLIIGDAASFFHKPTLLVLKR